MGHFSWSIFTCHRSSRDYATKNQRIRAMVMRSLRFGFLLVLFTGAIRLRGATVLTCDEAALRAAATGGGTVTFGCDGTIVLGSTLVISNDTVLDATSRNVVFSGSNAVRVLSVKSGVRLSILNLTIANGRYRGTNAVTGSSNGRGESAFGAAIYNDGGIVD